MYIPTPDDLNQQVNAREDEKWRKHLREQIIAKLEKHYDPGSISSGRDHEKRAYVDMAFEGPRLELIKQVIAEFESRGWRVEFRSSSRYGASVTFYGKPQSPR